MGLSFFNASVETLCVHRVGNKMSNDGLILSESCLMVHDDIKKILNKYFIGSFQSEELYTFYHESDLSMNEVYRYCSNLFDYPDDIYEQSVNLAKHLFNKSLHPNIKTGEFYIAYITNCMLDNQKVDAIGLFKSERKDTFLQVYPKGGGFEIKCERGTNIKKLDKGCLVFNTNRENGYLVAVVDNTNKGADAKFWTDAFLNVHLRKDNYTQTQNMLSLCKNFVAQLPVDNGKMEKANMLNRSVEALKDDAVEVNSFAEKVFKKPELVSEFKNYKEKFQEKHDIELDETFTPSAEAVKRVAMGSMTTIKLDKNFDISIHGGEQYIVRGYDEVRGMYYYQLFFKEEK